MRQSTMSKSLTNFKLHFCCFFILVIALTGSYALTRCDTFQWTCKNGQCINSEDRCDGKVTCSDSSDETQELCAGVICPQFTTKCNYGACVKDKAKCDGVKDCADNSDEENCDPSQVVDTKNRGNSSASFNATRAIVLERSRSAKKKRNAEMVPSYPSLWCANRDIYADGDILSGFLNNMCSGVKDCINGSKSDEPCNPLPETRPDFVIPPGLFDVVTTPTVIDPITTTTPEPDGRSCPAIFDDPNISAVHAYNTSITVDQWEIIDEFREIFYRCRHTYVLYGSKDNHCVNGRWRYPIPKCSKVCSAMEIEGVTFSTKCKFGNSETPCTGLIRPNTRADISCSIGYRKPLRDVPETIQCGETGEWDYHPASCEPDCGKLPVSATPFINGGEPVNITKVPWHTAIYKSGGGGKYDHICGGTIYSAKLVISAAHCFWDVKRDVIEDRGLFTVAVGKVYRSYDASEPLFTQFFNFSEIHIPVSYGGAGRSYENDIAMLVLDNYIVYKDHIKPICIRWFQYAEREVKPGTVGRIAGWGKININDEFGEDLKAVDLPAFSKEECLKNDLTYNTYVTGEKFCVGAPDDESVCEGDSGGGYVVKNDDTETYYLWGVLSVGLGRTCDRNHLTTFTNIQYHKEMITDYEVRYRPK